MERAGKLRSGEFAAERSVKAGKSRLCIVSEDASDNTKKKFRNMCAYRSIPYMEYGTKEMLGHAIGRSERSSLSLEDDGFAARFQELLDGGNANVR